MTISTPSAKILVVDDDQGILEALNIVVQELGYKVVTVDDAQKVVAAAEKEQPALILLDLLLSGTDGRDVVRTLRGTPSTKDIPIILMSADGKVQEKSQEVQTDGYLKKPFDLDVLEQLIKSHIRI